MIVDFVFCLEFFDIFGCDIDGVDGTDWYEDDGVFAEAYLLEVSLKLMLNIDESLSAPLNSIHLIHGDYKLVNSERFDDIGVLLCLSSTDK